jgi:rhamnosyltransferase
MICPSPSDICAVVVTYHPDGGLKERLERILPQLGGVVIVDNHSNPDALARLREISNCGKLKLIENHQNRGIATALNQGVHHAKQHGFSWVITFDQDSQSEPNLIETMLDVCRALGEQELSRLAVLGINHIDRNSQKIYVPVTEGRDWIELKTVITSGSLFSVAAYEDIGPFREDFFIDSVDHEYCLRARTKGYRVLLGLAPLLVHAMGNRKLKRVLPGLSDYAANYPPWRLYYMVRNCIVLSTEYFVKEPSWAVWRLAALMKRCGRVLILERNRREKAQYMLKGLRDGVLRRTSKLPD